MVLVKVLKRKDASSVMLAVLIALIVWQPLMQITSRPAAKLIGVSNSQYISYAPPNTGWKAQYLFPVVQIVIELIVLEVLGWIYVLARDSMKK